MLPLFRFLREVNLLVSFIFYSYRLEELAFTRSGDKGDSCNIGVVARSPSLYPYLLKSLSADAVGEYFGHVWGPELGSDAAKQFVKR